ncbi:MAG: substrate-binding domain-containing protein [Rectinemataceae bacterium]|jgi:ABC-type sugar transport system substrate-binding protein/AraC-like DNA-binding protein
MDDDIQLWGSRRRDIPPRPEFPELYPETDERHWWDLEFAGWNVGKEKLPGSPGDGPAGKRVICVHGMGYHPYMAEYDRGMAGEAERFGIALEMLRSDRDDELEAELVERAIRSRPDMMILSPGSSVGTTALFRRVHAAGIPLIASNLLPESEAFRYIVAWTGPDDWGQFRMLSRAFAKLMGGEGGYCIVNHIAGTSAYFARRWAVVTELAKVAPRMELLDMADTGLGTETTREAVLAWIDRFGGGLKGIICADDALAQLGVNQALGLRGREDVIRAANGATSMGMRFIKEGSLNAITWQPPDLDGAISIQVAVDYFNGLAVEPIRYLPIYLVDRGNIDDFLIMGRRNPEIDLDSLTHLVAECDLRAVERFFAEILELFRHERVLAEEYFRGFCIELVSRLAAIARSVEPPLASLYLDYESLFKQLFQQPSPRDTLAWLEALAKRLMVAMQERHRGCVSLGDRLRLYVDEGYREPLSLKVMSERFGMSAAYLGKVFREATGASFTSYLNRLRIAAALRILETRKVKAKDVALAVGYADPNYFYSVFKKVTGRYPSEIQGD